MARPIKQGIDYFPMDVGFLQDIKVKKIMRACGAQSVSVLICLLCNIYKNAGYYIEWDGEMPFLMADEIGISEGAVIEIVSKAVQVDFFHAAIYEKFSILTSKGIQERFFAATSRKTVPFFDGRIMLISLDLSKNSTDLDESTQSKVKESKVKESKVKKIAVVDSNTNRLVDEPPARLAELNSSYRASINPEPTCLEYEALIQWQEQGYADDLIIACIAEAARVGARNLKYIGAILRDCQKVGIKTAEQFAARAKAWEKSKQEREKAKPQHSNSGAKRSRGNFAQRQYTEDDFSDLYCDLAETTPVEAVEAEDGR